MYLNELKITGYVKSVGEVVKTKTGRKYQCCRLVNTLEHDGEEYNHAFSCIMWNETVTKFKKINQKEQVFVTGYVRTVYRNGKRVFEIVIEDIVNIKG